MGSSRSKKAIRLDSSKKTALKNRYERVFEERNRALRVLYDTAVQLENDDKIFSLLCNNLKTVTGAQLCMLTSFKPSNSTAITEAIAVEDSISKHKSHFTRKHIKLPKAIVKLLSIERIRQFDKKCLSLRKLFPDEYAAIDPLTENFYCISSVRNNELVAIAIIKLPSTIKLKLKDIIETYMNCAGMAIQRIHAQEALIVSREALRKAEEKSRRTLENCGVCMCEIDLNYTILNYNKYLLSLVGLDGEKLPRIKCYKLFKSHLCRTVQCPLKRMKKERVRIEAEMVWKNPGTGKEIYGAVIATPILENGQLTGIIEAVQDITLRKQMEHELKKSYESIKEQSEILEHTQAQLVQTAKMSAIGTLAAGIAHEFNNILCIISGYVQYWKNTHGIEAVLQTIPLITKAVTRGQQINKALMEFSRDEEEVIREFYLNVADSLNNNITIMEEYFNQHGLSIEKQFDDVPLLACTTKQLPQVFMNIMENARDAMIEKSGEKKLTITLQLCKYGGRCELFDKSKKVTCRSSLGCIWVTFSDTGIGMSEKIKEKIFDPFFTTKGILADGNVSKPGTGLGLTISHAIIRRHNGEIYVESEQGKGTSVFVRIPLSGKQRYHSSEKTTS